MLALWKHCLIAISVTAIIIPVIGKPCFITNCPPGGKRSNHLSASSSVYDGSDQRTPHHQVTELFAYFFAIWFRLITICLKCVKCGPGGEGTCFGSNMCCGSTFGCFFNTKETNICLLTNLTSLRSCSEKFWNTYLKATSCNLDAGTDSLDGTCVADRLCCSFGN